MTRIRLADGYRSREELRGPDVRIFVSGLWVSTMLICLLGDALRISAGDFIDGEMDGVQATRAVWLGAALIMLIPHRDGGLVADRAVSVYWLINIVVAALLVVFTSAGLPYPGVYDNVLIVISFVFEGAVIWYAWTWVYPSPTRPSSKRSISLR